MITARKTTNETRREESRRLAREVNAELSHYEWDNVKAKLEAVYVHRRLGRFYLDQGGSLDWPRWLKEAVHRLRKRGETAKIVPGGGEILPHLVTARGVEERLESY